MRGEIPGGLTEATALATGYRTKHAWRRSGHCGHGDKRQKRNREGGGSRLDPRGGELVAAGPRSRVGPGGRCPRCWSPDGAAHGEASHPTDPRPAPSSRRRLQNSL